VEPLLTLNYALPRMALNGSLPAGRQVLNVTAAHLPLALSAPVTGARVQVSFDDGRTWPVARVTRGAGGRFRAVFVARPGAWVTLRTSATDAAGATIAETITRAYRVAPAPAGGNRRGRPVGPGRWAGA
jgi:hypothetical protein